MTIFEELRIDHDKQRELLDILMDTSGNEETREDNFKLLKRQLEQHAIAEERQIGQGNGWLLVTLSDGSHIALPNLAHLNDAIGCFLQAINLVKVADLLKAY